MMALRGKDRAGGQIACRHGHEIHARGVVVAIAGQAQPGEIEHAGCGLQAQQMTRQVDHGGRAISADDMALLGQHLPACPVLAAQR